jgi:putative ABC transport system permease protein
MYQIALKMLVEDRAKFIGMVLSLALSTVIITQQMAIFLGLMRRTYQVIQDTPQAEIWIMNQSVKMVDDSNPIRQSELLRIKSIDGVKWAVPFFKGQIRAKLPNGQFQNAVMLGIDSATFIGGPYKMIEGKVQDLRKPFSIIVDETEANDKLAQDQGPGKPKKPLRVGDTLELNDRRALVVGICRVSRGFRTEPLIYTTFDRALEYVPFERKQLSFILAHSDHTTTPEKLARKIEAITGLKAFTKKEFEDITIGYYLKNTGIPINFGIAVLLGLIVGAAIAGQIFFNFTTENLKYFALLNVIGATSDQLAKMVLVQAAWVAFLGWGIGSGSASLLGLATQTTQLAFYLPWQLFIGTGILMFLISMISSLISINRIFNIQLWTLFKQ